MESITSSAVAGLIAALAATAILGLTAYVRHWLAKRRDVRYIRDLFIEGRRRVMDAKDTFHEDMDARSSAGSLRAAQYNNLLKRVGVALDLWTVNLTHAQRKDIYDALDWYHTDDLPALKRDGKAVYVELPYGKWPTLEMSLEAARETFERLQSIKWLKLEVE